MSKGFLFYSFRQPFRFILSPEAPKKMPKIRPVFQAFGIFLEVAIEPSRADFKTFLLHNHHLKNGSLDNKNADWINEHRDISIMGNQMGMHRSDFTNAPGYEPQSSLRVHHVANNGMC